MALELSLSLAQAVDAFGVGFARTRSRQDDYRYERHGRIGVLREGERRKRDRRTAEILISGEDLLSDLEQALKVGKGLPEPFRLCSISARSSRDAGEEAAIRAAGCRLLRTEPFFVRDYRSSPGDEMSPGFARVRRVSSSEEGVRLSQAQGARPMPEQDYLGPDADLHRYAAWEGEQVLGFVTSVRVNETVRWVASLWVHPDYRRQGWGAALMHALAAGDQAVNVRQSVLLASASGARLYPRVGYRQIGLLSMWIPPRSARGGEKASCGDDDS